MLNTRKTPFTTITVAKKERPKDPKRGERITALRLARGFKTQAELAVALGYTQSATISDWEAGAGISDRNLRRLARALNTTTDRILEGTESQVAASVAHVPRGTSADETQHTLDAVRRAVTRYNLRRAQHAPAEELRRASREIDALVRNLLELGEDGQDLETLTNHVVSLLTSEAPAQPVHYPVTVPAKKAREQ